MVAVIKSGASIRGTFLYNENKVKEGIADCLMAVNYPMDAEDMTENMRLNMLLKIAERRPSMKRNSIHISLNFAPEEKHSREFLKELAQDYMQRIGFGQQPYLIYQHFDSGHPHLHVVTTKIKADGGYVDTQNIAKNRSEPARKEMEIHYGLVRAEDHKKGLFQPEAVNAAVIQYGKTPTKRAISSILSAVLNKYKYTSIAELNALLGLYNVIAQRGEEDSRLYKNRGLMYRVINAEGHPISTPIKSSAFHQKAKLSDIEARFLRNDVERQSFKKRIKTAIDWNLKGSDMTIEQLTSKLKLEGIDTVIRRNEDGFMYGLTFIDHRTKCIFNGSDIGKQYSAAAIQERLKPLQQEPPQQHVSASSKASLGKASGSVEHTLKTRLPIPNDDAIDPTKDQKGILEQLTESEQSNNYLPYELRKTRKKRKKRNNHL
jgi:hypothetical protein